MIIQIRKLEPLMGHERYCLVALEGKDPESPDAKQLCECDTHTTPVTAYRCREARRRAKLVSQRP